MAQYPNRVRVSPSGTFADGATDPFISYAGVVMAPDLTSGPFAGSIGDEGSVNAPSLFLTRSGQPLPAAIVAETNKLTIFDATADVLGFDAGTWKVEMELPVSVDFDSLPANDESVGLLRLRAAFVNDSTIAAVTEIIATSSPLPQTGNASTAVVVHSTKYTGFLTVTPAMVQANSGQPLTGFYAQIERIDGGVATPYASYTSTSGGLLISKDLRVSVSKYR